MRHDLMCYFFVFINVDIYVYVDMYKDIVSAYPPNSEPLLSPHTC